MKKLFRFLRLFVFFGMFASHSTQPAWSEPVVYGVEAATEPSRPASWHWQSLAVLGGPVHALATIENRIFTGNLESIAGYALAPLTPASSAFMASTLWNVKSEEVTSLCATASGALWAATPSGLQEIEAGTTHSVRQVGFGGNTESILRLACSGSAIAAATEEGTYFSLDGQTWHALEGRLRFARAEAVQWETDAGRHEKALGVAVQSAKVTRLWILSQGELWWSEVMPGNAMTEPVRIDGFAAFASRTPVDFMVTADEIFVLYTEGVAVAKRTPSQTVAKDLLRANAPGADVRLPQAWQWAVLSLAPGAEVKRLFFASGTYWILTEQGLFAANHPLQEWRRAGAPIGFDAIYDFCDMQDRVVVATASGVWQGLPQTENFSIPKGVEIEAGGDVASPSQLAFSAQDPGFAEVRAAALAYLRLERAHVENLSERITKRGFLPKFVLSGGRSRTTNFSRNYDETYSSGATHSLHDWERRRENDWDVAASFAWDFGDTVYHNEMIDVSAERRKVLELRDRILDELAQLYFERQRVLLDLAAQTDRAAPEALRLKLRAQELSAGIDAWTGGWFSRTK